MHAKNNTALLAIKVTHLYFTHVPLLQITELGITGIDVLEEDSSCSDEKLDELCECIIRPSYST